MPRLERRLVSVSLTIDVFHIKMNPVDNVVPEIEQGVIGVEEDGTINPIMSAVINTIMNNTQPGGKKIKEKVPPVKCEVCDCTMSSQAVYETHLKGSKHRKKLMAKEILDKQQTLGQEVKPDPNDEHSFKCEVCCVLMNSPQQAELHVRGAKHKKNIAKSASTGYEDGPASKKMKVENNMKAFRCDLCSIIVNSQMQIDEHMQSRKHLNKLKAPPERSFRGPQWGPPEGQQNGLSFNRRFQYRGPPFHPGVTISCRVSKGSDAVKREAKKM